MMAGDLTCERCGASLSASDSFCGTCGSPVAGPTSEQSRTGERAQTTRAGAPMAARTGTTSIAANASGGDRPAPGWYPAPEGGGRRYWDGQRWTDRYESPRVAPAAPRTAVPRHQLLRFTRVVALIFAWITLIGGTIGIIAAFVFQAELGYANGVFAGIVLVWIVFFAVECALLFSYPVLIRLALQTEETARAALDLLAE